MAFIDCVIWNPQGSPMVYAYKYPHNNLSTYTQLVVNESQEALLFCEGRLMGKFGPGRHTLDTKNVPLLRTFMGLPFGQKNPYTAEVWFVNRVEVFNIAWAVGHMSVHDADYNTMLPLMATGQYGLKITDPEKFLIKVVGTRNEFTEYDMTGQFAGEFATKSKSAIVKFMTANHVGYKQISAFLDDLSNHLRQVMAPFWEELGLELSKFYVSTVDIDASTPEGARIKDALARQSSQSITGHTWQQEKLFETANSAIGGMNSGSMGGGGLLGGLMAINMMNGMGGAMGGAAMTPNYNAPTFGPSGAMQGAVQGGMQQGAQQAPRMVFCSSCARKFPSNMAYCPHCGNQYRPCPSCGTDNPEGARRCVSCGTQLQRKEKCPRCGNEVGDGALFCPSCGATMASAASAMCTRCGRPFPDGSKFCPYCGNKRQ